MRRLARKKTMADSQNKFFKGKSPKKKSKFPYKNKKSPNKKLKINIDSKKHLVKRQSVNTVKYQEKLKTSLNWKVQNILNKLFISNNNFSMKIDKSEIKCLILAYVIAENKKRRLYLVDMQTNTDSSSSSSTVSIKDGLLYSKISNQGDIQSSQIEK